MANISLGAKTGFPVVQASLGEWTTYTPQGSWGNCTYAGKWKQDGSDILLKIGLTLTGAPTGALTMTTAQLLNGILYNGAQITYALAANAANANKMPWGKWAGTDTGVNDYHGFFTPSDATLVTPTGYCTYINSGATTLTSVSATAPFTWGASDKIGISIRVPIAEWQGMATQAYGAGQATSQKSGLVSYEDSGTFPIFLNSGTGVNLATGTAAYSRIGKTVTVHIPALTSTTTATDIRLSSTSGSQTWPAGLTPSATRAFLLITNNNNVGIATYASITSAGLFQLSSDASGNGFSASSVPKGTLTSSVTYLVS